MSIYWRGMLCLTAGMAMLLASCTPAQEAAPEPTAAPAAAVETIEEETTGRPAGVPAAGESAVVDRIYENGVLRGGCAPTPPHCMVDPDTNEWIGLGPETGKKLAEAMGVEYETVGVGWDAIVAGLPSGQFDVVVTGLTYRPERDEVVDFTILGQYGFCVLARADDDRVQTWDSFVDNPELRLGQITGVAEEGMVQTDYPSINLVSIPTEGHSLWEEVLTNRIDGTLMGSISVPIYIELGDGNLKAVPDDCLAAPLFGSEWGNAVAESDPILGYVESTIAELKDNGEWDELIEYWYQPDVLRMGIDAPSGASAEG